MALMCYNRGNKKQTDTGVQSTYTRSNHQQRNLRMATSNHTTSIPYGYCHCGCGQKTNLYQTTHTNKGQFKGQPTLFILGHSTRLRPQPDQAELFWSKVAITADDNQCWIWQAGKVPNGYGKFNVRKKTKAAHRLAWMFPNYVIPNHMEICHSCDNPACCNPKHLFIGTRQDNTDDMMRKGRQAPPEQHAHKGEAHPRHKLTYAQVVQIREEHARGNVTAKVIAMRYGVSPSCIESIVRRIHWK